MRDVDSRITDLYDEVKRLSEFLEAIEETLQKCKQCDPNLENEGLWNHSQLALSTCQRTLDELQLLVTNIPSKESPNFKVTTVWKARVAVDLKRHGHKLITYRERVQKSNTALQMLLPMITMYVFLPESASSMMNLG